MIAVMADTDNQLDSCKRDGRNCNNLFNGF